MLLDACVVFAGQACLAFVVPGFSWVGEVAAFPLFSLGFAGIDDSSDKELSDSIIRWVGHIEVILVINRDSFWVAKLDLRAGTVSETS